MRRVVFIMLVGLVLMISLPAQATLIDRGEDTLGNHLIFDTDLNITWYDYTKSATNWYNQMSWADNLIVTFDGRSFTDWRLPTTPGTTVGYTNEGEMGHLYYDELDNQAGGPLTNWGPFNNLLAYIYWSGSEYAPYPALNAWRFRFDYGDQRAYYKGDYNHYYALAVRSGDVVPEPTTMLLLGLGLMGVAGIRRKLHK